jgi:hypothetical protein
VHVNYCWRGDKRHLLGAQVRPWWEADSPQALPQPAQAAARVQAASEAPADSAAEGPESPAALRPAPHSISPPAAQPAAGSCAADAAGSLPQHAAGLSLSGGEPSVHSNAPDASMQEAVRSAGRSSSPTDVQQPVWDALNRPPPLAANGQLNEAPAGSPANAAESRASQERHSEAISSYSPALPSAQVAGVTEGRPRQSDAAGQPAADGAAEQRQQEAAAHPGGVAATPDERQRQRDRRQQFDAYPMDYYARDGGAWSSYYAPKPSGSAAGKLAAMRAARAQGV